MALYNSTMTPPTKCSPYAQPSMKSPVLDELFGKYDPDVDPDKYTKKEGFVRHHTAPDDRLSVSYNGSQFLKYISEYPEIMTGEYAPCLKSVSYTPAKLVFRYDDVPRNGKSMLTIHLVEGNKDVYLEILNVDENKTVNRMHDADKELYNKMLSVIEDYTKTPIEKMTHGVYHYLEIV